MGLFQQRPEAQQNDWAGLPAEPYDPIPGIDTLPPATADLAAPPANLALEFGEGTAVTVTSIEVPVALPDAPDGGDAD